MALRKYPREAASGTSGFMELILNSVADPIFVKDSAHRWVVLNDAYCSLFGAKREELLGKSDYDCFPKEQADIFWEKDRIVFETGEVNENEELFTDSSGRVHTILTRKSRYFDANGAAYLVGSIRDITDQKEAETRRLQLISEKEMRQAAELQRKVLEETARRLRDILEAIPVGIFVLDHDGGIAHVNGAVRKIWGGDAPVVHGVPGYAEYRGWWADSHVALKPEDWPAVRTIRNGEVCTGDVIDIQRFDGKRSTILASSAPLLNLEGALDGAVVAHQDVSELKRAKEAAENASRMKSEFLDIAAHELKTPLTSITILSDFLGKQVSERDSSGGLYIEKLREQVKRLSALVEGLLNASRLERGGLTLHPQPVELCRIVSETVEMFRLRAPERRFVLTVPFEPIHVEADPARISQVLGNLLDNALEYAHEGPIEIEIKTTEKDATRMACISVTDHGPGIPKEKQKDLFTRFYRVLTDEALRHPGLGLGLYISRRIMELHGGSLGVSSEPGRGSTFFAEMPVVGKKENA